jgi:hypothetical protein
MKLKHIAWSLSIILSAWWFYFAYLIYSDNDMDWILENPMEVLPTIAIVVTAIIAWRAEILGGILFTLEGILFQFFYKFDDITSLIMSSVLPIANGILYLIVWKTEQRARIKHYVKTPGISK